MAAGIRRISRDKVAAGPKDLFDNRRNARRARSSKAIAKNEINGAIAVPEWRPAS